MLKNGSRKTSHEDYYFIFNEKCIIELDNEILKFRKIKNNRYIQLVKSKSKSKSKRKDIPIRSISYMYFKADFLDILSTYIDIDQLESVLKKYKIVTNNRILLLSALIYENYHILHYFDKNMELIDTSDTFENMDVYVKQIADQLYYRDFFLNIYKEYLQINK